MNTHVCEEHGDDIVVFHGRYETECPWCKVNIEIDDLKQQVKDIEDERDSLQSEVDSLLSDQENQK